MGKITSTASNVSQSMQSARWHLPSASWTMSAPSPMAPACATTPLLSSSESGANNWLNLPESRPVFFQNAAVHHHEYPGFARFLRRLLVNHVFLHPDRRNSQLNGLIHNFFHELRPAKNVHDVDLLRYLEQRSISLLAQTGLNVRIHRNDAVTLALHVGRNPVAGTHRVAGESDHGDGLCLL